MADPNLRQHPRRHQRLLDDVISAQSESEDLRRGQEGGERGKGRSLPCLWCFESSSGSYAGESGGDRVRGREGGKRGQGRGARRGDLRECLINHHGTRKYQGDREGREGKKERIGNGRKEVCRNDVRATIVLNTFAPEKALLALSPLRLYGRTFPSPNNAAQHNSALLLPRKRPPKERGGGRRIGGKMTIPVSRTIKEKEKEKEKNIELRQ